MCGRFEGLRQRSWPGVVRDEPLTRDWMERVVGGSGRIVRWEMVIPCGVGTLKITSTSLKIEINGPQGFVAASAHRKSTSRLSMMFNHVPASMHLSSGCLRFRSTYTSCVYHFAIFVEVVKIWSYDMCSEESISTSHGIKSYILVNEHSGAAQDHHVWLQSEVLGIIR